jgi:hypothetical protein
VVGEFFLALGAVDADGAGEGVAGGGVVLGAAAVGVAKEVVAGLGEAAP